MFFDFCIFTFFKVLMMEIRKALLEDLDNIMPLYDRARSFMASTGNGNQWINGYPSRDLISADINEGHLYVCTEKEYGIVGVFYFRIGNDHTYEKIYEGKWLDDAPYGVAHRLASGGKVKGVAACCLDWCFEQCGNMRVDTHRDNKVLQSILQKMGYEYCGIIIIDNGTERLAYQKRTTPEHID